MKIGIFCQFNAPFKGVADITVPVMREYADRHGYHLTVHEDRPISRSIVWDRYEILAQEIGNHDWVVHMDADVLITNLHIRLEEFCYKRDGFVISTPICEDGERRMNDGVAMFKNFPLMGTFLMDAFAAKQEGRIQCGQDYLDALWRSGDYSHLFHIERHKAINAFIYEEYGMPATTVGNWTPGDFVLHLPGRTNERRIEIFNQITPQILR